MVYEDSQEERGLHGRTSKAGSKRTRQLPATSEDDELGDVNGAGRVTVPKRDGRFHFKERVATGVFKT